MAETGNNSGYRFGPQIEYSKKPVMISHAPENERGNAADLRKVQSFTSFGPSFRETLGNRPTFPSNYQTEYLPPAFNYSSFNPQPPPFPFALPNYHSNYQSTSALPVLRTSMTNFSGIEQPQPSEGRLANGLGSTSERLSNEVKPHKGPDCLVDSKYVAELEMHLGRLRVDHADISDRLSSAEARLKVEADKRETLVHQFEQMAKEAQASNELADKLRRAEAQLELSRADSDAKGKALLKLQEESFVLAFDRVAYDSMVRQNELLKANLQQASDALADLKQRFMTYTWLVSPDSHKAEERQRVMQNLELVV